jgi:hypothetical protein
MSQHPLVLIAFGLLVGGVCGYFAGERFTLRDLFQKWPRSREHIMAAGYPDPDRKWWQTTKHVRVWIIMLTIVVALASTEGLVSGGQEPEPPSAAVEAASIGAAP